MNRTKCVRSTNGKHDPMTRKEVWRGVNRRVTHCRLCGRRLELRTAKDIRDVAHFHQIEP